MQMLQGKGTRYRVQGKSGRVNFFITGSESKFHGGLPLDSLRLEQPFPRKLLNKIFYANAQNFILQEQQCVVE